MTASSTNNTHKKLGILDSPKECIKMKLANENLLYHVLQLNILKIISTTYFKTAKPLYLSNSTRIISGSLSYHQRLKKGVEEKLYHSLKTLKNLAKDQQTQIEILCHNSDRAKFLLLKDRWYLLIGIILGSGLNTFTGNKKIEFWKNKVQKLAANNPYKQKITKLFLAPNRENYSLQKEEQKSTLEIFTKFLEDIKQEDQSVKKVALFYFLKTYETYRDSFEGFCLHYDLIVKLLKINEIELSFMILNKIGEIFIHIQEEAKLFYASLLTLILCKKCNFVDQSMVISLENVCFSYIKKYKEHFKEKTIDENVDKFLKDNDIETYKQFFYGATHLDKLLKFNWRERIASI